MIGRKEELKQLETLYQSDKFEFLVMYGRRRVGKTTILQEFANKHKVIFFSAQEKNDALNLQDFSKSIQLYFDNDFIAGFPSWKDAFSYISKKTGNQKTVLIIDEFPFIAEQNPSIKSILQHEIDHEWKKQNIFLILCGSSVSFMVNDVTGFKSPLYGRTTETKEVLPFDYLESAEFFPKYNQEEKLIAYGILGGIPRYLNAFTDNKSLEENIAHEIIRNGAFLNDEPEMLLKMELREPMIYNGILQAISGACNTLTEISDRIHEDKSKISKYLLTLQTIRLIDRKVPCGESSKSKKSIYVITDNYYKFWYRYVFTNKSYYNILGTEDAAKEVTEDIPNFMGMAFEDICKQYLIRQAKAKKLPFIPYLIDKWWGNNPAIKAQDDVDILALSKDGKSGLFCECKFRNKPMPMEEYEDLIQAGKAFPNIKEKYFMFFSKGGYTSPVIKRAAKEGTILLKIQDLFEG